MRHDAVVPADVRAQNQPFPVETQAAESVETKGDAQVADAKDIETQTPATLNETKPADEKQLDTNEELERQ